MYVYIYELGARFCLTTIFLSIDKIILHSLFFTLHLFIMWCVDVGHTVVKFGELAAVPTVGSTYEVASDALQLVDVVTSALRANGEVGIRIFVAAV